MIIFQTGTSTLQSAGTTSQQTSNDLLLFMTNVPKILSGSGWDLQTQRDNLFASGDSYLMSFSQIITPFELLRLNLALMRWKMAYVRNSLQNIQCNVGGNHGCHFIDSGPV